MAEIRKLAAILAADVAGYSRLAASDKERTLARLRALRSDLIDPGSLHAAFQNVKFAVTAPPLTTPLATTVDPVGVIAGGGVEFAILPNLLVKAEYLYVSFNNQTIGPGTFTLIENVVRGGVIPVLAHAVRDPWQLAMLAAITALLVTE